MDKVTQLIADLDDKTLELIKEHYNCLDSRSWFFFPIEMPLLDNNGPAKISECDQLTYEVWDSWCNSYSVHNNLYDAINDAIKFNSMLLDND